MKKSFLLCAMYLVISISSTTNAQTLQFGGKIGLNFAHLDGNDVLILSTATTRVGLVIGGFMVYDFAPLFAVQPEALYSMKGASGTMQGVDFTYSFNYIEIPVLLKFKIPLAQDSPVSADIHAGPDFAFNVASSFRTSGGFPTQTIDVSDETKSFEFNLAFGCGVGFGVGPRVLGLEFRYTRGTGTIDKSGGDMRNGVFALIANVTL